MNNSDELYKKYLIVEDAAERAWEYKQIQDAAKKAKAMMKTGQKVNFNTLADEYGVSPTDIKKACSELSNETSRPPLLGKRHPILDDKERLENILHDLESIARQRYISPENRKDLLAAQDLVVKVADDVQVKISQTNLYPNRYKKR
jgi:hypothetical protein